MPPRRRSLAAVVRAAEEVLRRNRVDHVFVGAISVIVFGEPRTTRDVDILAKLPRAQIAPLAAGFRRHGFLASEEDLRTALREGAHSTLEDSKSPLRIDLAPIVSYADRHALRRRVRVRWRGLTIPVAGPDHTVVMKLKFGSSQDLEDAFGILAEQRDALDFDELRAFARHERVLAALEAMMRRSRVKRRD